MTDKYGWSAPSFTKAEIRRADKAWRFAIAQMMRVLIMRMTEHPDQDVAAARLRQFDIDVTNAIAGAFSGPPQDAEEAAVRESALNFATEMIAGIKPPR